MGAPERSDLAKALLAGSSRPPADVDLVALQRSLEDVLRVCRQAWPTARLTDLQFVDALAARLASDRPLSEAIAAIHATDLFLVIGCVAGEPFALVQVSEHLLPEVCASLRRIDTTAALTDEVGQRLRQRLLVAVDGHAPRLNEYSGQGPLLHWLRAIAVRDALKLRQSEERQADVEAQALAGGMPMGDLELEIIRRLQTDDFRTAFDSAFRALSARERNLLRMHVLDGLTIDQMGAFYRTHRTTAFRWLDAARDALSQGIRNALSDQLGLSTRELESLMGLIRSQLDLSLPRLLKVSTP